MAEVRPTFVHINRREPALLLKFQNVHRVDTRTFYSVISGGDQNDQQCDESGYNEIPGIQINVIGKIIQPLLRQVPGGGPADRDSNDQEFCERAHVQEK